jgi:hypothetical protein
MLSDPVILRFADGSTQILTGRRYFLLDLFSGVCGGDLSPTEAAQLDLIRQCVAAEEPGGGRMIEAMQSLMGPLDEPVDGSIGNFQQERSQGFPLAIDDP